MFNDLNNANNQNRPSVDDIFAETDKSGATVPGGTMGGSNPAAPAATGADIETRHMGLNTAEGTAEEIAEKNSGGRWFRIVLILIIAAILILGGYLAYSKFFAVQKLDLTTTPIVAETIEETSGPVSVPSNEVGSFVTPISGGEEPAGNTEVLTPVTTIPEIPGVNAPAVGEGEATNAGSEVTPVSLVDSDSDGLSDIEEATAGTNINVIDTDNDGLSDYEEIQIFKTNPLNSDTDGDTYSDGAEVKNGYNPNGDGKLSETTSN